MKRALLVCLLLGSVLAGTGAAASTSTSPSLNATLSHDRVSPGQETDLAVTVSNGPKASAAGYSPQNIQQMTTARDVRVTMAAGDAPIDVKTSTQVLSSQGSSRLPDGGAIPASFHVAVDENATPGTYTVPVHVSYVYTSESGPIIRDDKHAEKTLHVTLRVTDEARFAVVGTSTNATVGDGGTTVVSLRNVGTQAARNARVTVSSQAPQFVVSGGSAVTAAVGSWPAGAVRNVSLDTSVSDGAKTTRFPLQASVAYDNTNGNARSSDALSPSVTVGPHRDRFGVTPVAGNVTVGGADSVTFAVTNNGDSRVTNVNAKVYASGPISVGDDQAFAASLAPGQTKNLTFKLSASGSALAKPYPLQMDFQYDQDGSTKLSNYYQVPLAVSEPSSSGGLPVGYIAVGVVVVLALAGGYVYYRRQQ